MRKAANQKTGFASSSFHTLRIRGKLYCDEGLYIGYSVRPVEHSAFDMEMIFHSHANKTHFYKEGCALGLILKVRVFGTRTLPISA